MKAFGILGTWRRRLRVRQVLADAQRDFESFYPGGIDQTPSAFWHPPVHDRRWDSTVSADPDPRLLEQLIERGRPE